MREMATAKSNIALLNDQLRTAAEESLLTKAERDVVEAEARKQLEKATAMERQSAKMQESNQVMQVDGRTWRPNCKSARPPTKPPSRKWANCKAK